MASSCVRAHDQSYSAVPIDVIHSVLGIVLHDEDGCFRPELTLSQCFDDLSHRKIVIGHHSLCRRHTRLCTIGVIRRQLNHNQVRQSSFALHTKEVREKDLSANDVRNGCHIAGVIARRMLIESGNKSLDVPLLREVIAIAPALKQPIALARRYRQAATYSPYVLSVLLRART